MVEQTETPDQLEKRNREMKSAGRPQSKVVKREQVAVITRGTMRDLEMTSANADDTWVMTGRSGLVVLAICLVGLEGYLVSLRTVLFAAVGSLARLVRTEQYSCCYARSLVLQGLYAIASHL